MPALRILWQVAVYRLVRLEMANLVAAGAIVVALHTPWPEAGLRVAFGVLLNLLVYLNNDYHDVEDDLLAPSKDAEKTKYLHEHMGWALGAQIVLTLGLAAAAAFFDTTLFVPLVIGGGVCWAYSAVLKRRPGVDVLAMVVWGASMPAVAFAYDNLLGWALVGLLALASGAFESVQVIRDVDEDRETGVRTTAVVLGAENTWWLQRAFVVLAAVYTALVLQRWAGPVALVALILPRTDASKYWNLLRFVLGLVFLAALAQAYFTGHSDGWLVQLGR